MAGKLNLIYKTARGQFTSGINDMHRPIALTATKGMKELSEKWKIAGRANITGAGLGDKQAKALRVDYFPELPKTSADAAVFLHHKTHYIGVFEDGSTISGKPLLWVPLPSTPTPRRKRKQPVVKSFFALIGQKPISMKRKNASDPPVIGANIRRAKNSRAKKVSLAALKRGKTGAKGVVTTVPLFVGVKKVKEPNLLNLTAIHKSFANQVGKFYTRNFKDRK